VSTASTLPAIESARGGPRARLRHWWLSRLPATDQWTLGQRNIYIVPTRAGLAFCATLVVLLVATINYQLNLGYALTFLLAGSALASMHMTHGTLRGLTLHMRPPAATFAGQPLVMEIVLTNPGRTRHGLGLGTEADWGSQPLAWAEAPTQGQGSVTVSCIAAKRGRVTVPPLRIESRFPFGLFRAWSIWRPNGQVWVYPAPETPAAELPPVEPVPAVGPRTMATSGAEFEGVRPWQRGDSLRQVVWKKVARSGEMVSRESRQGARQQLWLDWRQTPLGDPETRLSRLAAWVLAAEQRGLDYGLRLPGHELPCDHGPTQRDAALRMLAEWSA